MKERKNINTHFELEVYQRAFIAAMRIFELSKIFPPEERYSLTDQVRRSSRSVCVNIAESWRSVGIQLTGSASSVTAKLKALKLRLGSSLLLSAGI
jgi:hypothetical protein